MDDLTQELAGPIDLRNEQAPAPPPRMCSADPTKAATPSRYDKRRCRCQPCRAAHAAAHARRAATATERGRADPNLIPHGTPNGYRYWGCRCTPCTDASNAVVNTWKRTHRRTT